MMERGPGWIVSCDDVILHPMLYNLNNRDRVVFVYLVCMEIIIRCALEVRLPIDALRVGLYINIQQIQFEVESNYVVYHIRALFLYALSPVLILPKKHLFV